MKRILFVSMLWMALVGTAQAGEPEFVQVSPGVWMVTVKNHAGIFASAATTKRKALLAANAFASAKNMQAYQWQWKRWTQVDQASGRTSSISSV